MIKTTAQPDDEVLAYEPNCTMKGKLGHDFSLGALVSEATIAACEGLLNDASSNFFNEADAELMALETLSQTPMDTPQQLDQLQTHAYNIKSHAKVLGFTFITEICAQLIATILSNKLAAEKKPVLVAQLVQALRLAFTMQIRDDGGSVGQELQARLLETL